MSFHPIGPRVLVKFVTPETKTASGLIIPDTAQKRHQQAEVVAVGTGHYTANGVHVPNDLKVGDIVAINQHAHTVAPITIDGEVFHVVDERPYEGSEVFGFFRDDEE